MRSKFRPRPITPLFGDALLLGAALRLGDPPSKRRKSAVAVFRRLPVFPACRLAARRRIRGRPGLSEAPAGSALIPRPRKSLRRLAGRALPSRAPTAALREACVAVHARQRLRVHLSIRHPPAFGRRVERQPALHRSHPRQVVVRSAHEVISC